MPRRGQQKWKPYSHNLKLVAVLETSSQEGPMVWGGTQQRMGYRGRLLAALLLCALLWAVLPVGVGTELT